MNHRSGFEDATTPTTGERFAVNSLHPAWRALGRHCADLRHGEIGPTEDSGRLRAGRGNQEEDLEDVATSWPHRGLGMHRRQRWMRRRKVDRTRSDSAAPAIPANRTDVHICRIAVSCLNRTRRRAGNRDCADDSRLPLDREKQCELDQDHRWQFSQRQRSAALFGASGL